MAEYPERDAYFAHRTFRLMTKVCAAQEIGSDAMLLVAVILHVEDSKRYRGPVSFFNGQLIPILGFTSWGRLDRARKSAMNAGWLHYESNGKRKAGSYWGTVPDHLEDVDDSPIDEDYHHIVGDSGGSGGDKQEAEGETTSTLPPPVEVETGLRRDGDVIETGLRRDDVEALPPIPIPIPIPKEESARATKRFVKPTLDEVRAYCSDRKNSIDAEHFIDHYESNGWKVGKNSMKDWKAAVRTWERNGVGGKNEQSASGKRSAIDAWAIAVKLAKYQSRFAQHEPDKWDRLRKECPADVLKFTEDFGLKSIQDGKVEIVRGQFAKLWNDSS